MLAAFYDDIVHEEVYNICDRLCENWTCRGINKNEIYPKTGGKRKFMDILIMNSPVSFYLSAKFQCFEPTLSPQACAVKTSSILVLFRALRKRINNYA